MKYQKRLIFLFAISLFGCSLETYDVKLKHKTFEYDKQSFDVCKVIDKVNGNKISSYNREKGKIDEDDIHIICPELSIKELGKQEVVVKVNGVKTTINFNVEDTTPPIVDVEKDSFNVEAGNEYFDIKKMVNVTDKYDPHPIIGWSGDYDLTTPGEYTINVVATDSIKNSTRKELKVVVSEKHVEVIEKAVIVNGNSNNISGSSQTAPSTDGPASNPTTSSLSPMTWLFSDGFNLQTGFDKCQSYRGNQNGSCKPLRDAAGIPYGYQYLP